MNKEFILSKLKEIKPVYEKEGLIILGIFGSYSEDKQKDSSDIDVLIETTDTFVLSNDAFDAFEKLELLKRTLSQTFGKKVDLADKKGFQKGSLGETYILKKAIYV